MPLSLPLIWFFIGIMFTVAEFFVPGLIIIFFGAGAFITALATKIFSISNSIQVIIFIVSSISLLFSVRKFLPKTFLGSSDTGTNEYDDSIVGKKGTVTVKIEADQEGEIKFQGSFWKATSTVTIDAKKSVIIEGKDPNNSLILLVNPQN